MTNHICVFYMAYSGGKFISNCLALSKHVLCNNPKLAAEDLTYTVFDQNYYNFKLQSVLSSLTVNFNITKTWSEFGELNEKDYLQCDRTVCHIAHQPEQQQAVNRQYNNLRTLRLINFYKFNSCAFLLKSGSVDIERHQNGIQWWLENTQSGDIELDMDQIMYYPDTFLPNIKRLYNYFEFEDFNPTLLDTFYREYRSLHNIE